MTLDEHLMKLISTYDGEDIDLCYYVFEDLKKVNEKEASIGLKTFFEKIKSYESNRTLKLENYVTKEELIEYHKIYSRYVNELLNILVKKAHLDEWKTDEFYFNLWNMLFNNSLFNNNSKCYAVALLCLAQNPLLPYVELDKPMGMTNEKFSLLSKEQIISIQKIRHILKLEFSQKTEISSLILNELLKTTDYEKQVVLLAITLNEFIKTQLRKDSIEDFLNFMKEVKLVEK